MISRLYNNIGISALGIAFTTQSFDGVLPISKALLIRPIVAHRLLLNHLSRKGVVVSNVEKLLVSKTQWFANFDARFYDGLCESMNAIQLLVDLEIAELNDEGIRVVSTIAYDKQMGKRASKMDKASSNIASLLKMRSEDLYSNLRVRL